jgi:hypothetical protein
MSWMERMILGGMLRAPEGDGGSGGGGGTGGGSGAGGSGGAGSGGNAGGGNADHAKQVEALTAANKSLEERLAKLEGKGAGGGGGGQDDPDLIEKAKREAATKAKGADDAKKIESAIRFSLGAKEWVKQNEALLPKEVSGIFAEAEKEKFDSAIEKDSAIKASLVQSFFSQQANLDLLTSSQKSAIEDFTKLTKNGKQEKAQAIYDQIFEPTFEMLKRVKKAEQLRVDGHATNSTDAEKAYKERMINLSRKHYTGAKPNA